jgi:hypothetical protein
MSGGHWIKDSTGSFHHYTDEEYNFGWLVAALLLGGIYLGWHWFGGGRNSESQPQAAQTTSSSSSTSNTVQAFPTVTTDPLSDSNALGVQAYGNQSWNYGLIPGEGACVFHVMPQGPAGRAGIHSGDIVIKADGAPIGLARDPFLGVTFGKSDGTIIVMTGLRWVHRHLRRRTWHVRLGLSLTPTHKKYSPSAKPNSGKVYKLPSYYTNF